MCIVGRIHPVHNVHKLCEPEHDFDQQECNFEGPPCVLKNHLIIQSTTKLHKLAFKFISPMMMMTVSPAL